MAELLRSCTDNAARIVAAGYVKTNVSSKSVEFRNSKNEYFYLNNLQSRIAVFNPDIHASGIMVHRKVGKERFSSSFSNFPRKKKGGDPNNFGTAYHIDNDVDLLEMIKSLVGV